MNFRFIKEEIRPTIRQRFKKAHPKYHAKHAEQTQNH
jgi:hypothetical protein